MIRIQSSCNWNQPLVQNRISGSSVFRGQQDTDPIKTWFSSVHKISSYSSARVLIRITRLHSATYLYRPKAKSQLVFYQCLLTGYRYTGNTGHEADRHPQAYHLRLSNKVKTCCVSRGRCFIHQVNYYLYFIHYVYVSVSSLVLLLLPENRNIMIDYNCIICLRRPGLR